VEAKESVKMDLALLFLRLTVGVLLAGHGAQKLFGWFGGHGFRRTAGWLASMGFVPAGFWALLAGLTEFAGGLLFALGLFCPVGSLAIGASMVTAIARVHWPKVWATDGGFELPFKNLVVVVAVAMTGPGAISLDRIWGTALPPAALWPGVVVVICGCYYALISSTLAAASGAAEPTAASDPKSA
jgi:putative oxidoreductase